MNKVTDVVISHSSVISLHVQLHNQLRQLILSGRWAVGTRLPSESQLAEHLKLSRSTVRLALQQAEIEGLIERNAGRGTFVAYHAPEEHEKRLIAFVACGFDAESQLIILNGAESEMKAAGYQIIFSNAQSYQEQLNVLKRMSEEDVAGILIWPTIDNTRTPKQNALNYGEIHLPIVWIDRTIEGVVGDCVTSDNYGGAQAMMRHLIQLGHRHIAFLSHHEMGLLPVMERYRAYCDGLREADAQPIDPWLIGKPGKEITASQTLRASVDAKSVELQQIKHHLSNAQPRPTAIFAINDYLAVLALRAMKLLTLRVPDDISLAGFDDTDWAVHLEVPLTTVTQDTFMIGKRAAQLLLRRIGGYVGPPECDFIPTELRIRSSTSVPTTV